MNKKQWQQELQRLTLSESQKQQMKRHILAQPRRIEQKQWNWPVIVVPTFILLVGFCMILFVTDLTNETRLHQASQIVAQPFVTDHTDYFKTHISLSLAMSIGVLVNCWFIILIIIKTKRWQQSFIQKVRKVLYKSRYMLLIIAPFLLYSFASIIFTLLSVQAKIIGLYVIIFMLTCLSFLFIARNLPVKVSCPHCQYEYSMKEKRKLTAIFKTELHCRKCGGKLFYSKKTRQYSAIMTCMMSIFILIPANFGVPFWLVIIGGIVWGFLIIAVFLPLFSELEGEEEPLF